MFGKNAEEKVIKEADKITSLVEDLHSVSWDRVTELSKLLSEEHTEEQLRDWVRELTTIAQANISLLGKLDMLSNTGTGKTMSSGIELRTDDIYVKHDRSLESRLNLPKIDIPDPLLAAQTTGPISRIAEQPGNVEERSAQAKNEHSGIPEQEPNRMTQESSPKGKKRRGKKEFFIPTAQSTAPTAESNFMNGNSQDQSAIPNGAKGSVKMSSGMPLTPREQTPPSKEIPSRETNSVIPRDHPQMTEERTAKGMVEQDITEKVTVDKSAVEKDTSSDPSEDAGIKKKVDKGVARFKQLYSSRDGGLFLYEDEFGHLVAVDASKLA